VSVTDRQPLVVMIAGPNGGGKSTAASKMLQGPLAVQEFVNADTIARGLSAFRPEAVAVTAGKIMLRRLRELAETRADFAFETTLAGRNFAPWLRDLRASGYRAQLIFVSLPRPEVALARVADRVRLGGHNIPEEVVRRRFVAGLTNFFQLYRGIVDVWQMYDNLNASGPVLIASGRLGQGPEIVKAEAWENLVAWQR
jgi:predicted ABC-type ATPase